MIPICRQGGQKRALPDVAPERLQAADPSRSTEPLTGSASSLGGGLRGAFGGLCWRAVGWAPGAGQRTLDAGYALRQGVQAAAVR